MEVDTLKLGFMPYEFIKPQLDDGQYEVKIRQPTIRLLQEHSFVAFQKQIVVYADDFEVWRKRFEIGQECIPSICIIARVSVENGCWSMNMEVPFSPFGPLLIVHCNSLTKPLCRLKRETVTLYFFRSAGRVHTVRASLSTALDYQFDGYGLREWSYRPSLGHKASVSWSVLGVSSNGMLSPSIS